MKKLIALAGMLLMFAGVPTAAEALPPGCTAEVSPGQSLNVVNNLGPGSTLCLHAGNYTTGGLTISASGSATGGRIVVKEAPGEHAVVTGEINVTGSYVSVNNLWLKCNQSNPPCWLWQGDNVTWANDDMDGQGNYTLNGCYDRKCSGTVIARNHVYNCGSAGHGHCIYLDRINGAQVYDNNLGPAARNCIQLYPDADKVTITRNFTTGCGEAGITFAGGDEPEVPGCGASDNNNAYDNTFTKIISFWGCFTGVGNKATNNCAGSVDAPGVTVTGTLPLSDPACATKVPQSQVGPLA